MPIYTNARKTIKAHVLVWIYFSLIPLFAAIYTFWIPSDFIHSNIQYEQSYVNEKEQSLSRLSEALNEVFSVLVHSSNHTKTALFVDLRNLDYNDREYSYDLFFSCPENNDQCRVVVSCRSARVFDDYSILCQDLPEITSTLEIYFNVNNRFWKPNRNGFQSYSAGSGSVKDISSEIHFHLENNSLVSTERNPLISELVLSMQEHEMLEAGRQVNATFSVYLRMLYFSAVTITTLGFGDIAPISTRARMLVTLESVLGIILIGLFFSSIAANIKGNRDHNEMG